MGWHLLYFPQKWPVSQSGGFRVLTPMLLCFVVVLLLYVIIFVLILWLQPAFTVD